MTSNDPGHVNNLDENQIDLLKTYWLSLLSSINVDPLKFVYSPIGEELFYLFGKDNPDGILLRWLRARKWQISSSVQLMMDTLKWRQEWGLRKLMENGEKDLILEECSSNKIYHMGKDKLGRPITYVHASEHIKGQFPLEETEKFLVLNMEVGRYLVDPPIEQGTVVLDMGNITFKNLDYQHIKFMINVMQNYYPECLGVALIVNAPWTFNTVWSIIKPWLDPIVESKIHFLKNSNDLIEYIDSTNIPRRLEGNHIDLKYFPPKKEDQDYLTIIRQDKQGMKKAMEQYQQSAQHYFDLTIKWANSKTLKDEKLIEERTNATKHLSDRFKELMPYILTKTYYHRSGIINEPIFDQTYQKICDNDNQITHL